MLSIVIPSRNEKFLKSTILDILSKAKGDIEVIAVLDGYWMSNEDVVSDDRVIYLHKGKAHGMRQGINSGVAISSGDYILKIDAHCMVAEGFDLQLIKDHKPNWIQVPTRKRLDADKWEIQKTRKPDIDYLYISYPDDPNDRGGAGFHGRIWNEKNKDESLKKDKIIDLMSAQGSSYFIEKKYFYELELLDYENYGPFGCEFQEVGFKCWLSGGRVVRNKNTWYAHLHKGSKHGRGYFLNTKDVRKANNYTNKWVNMKEAWDKQTLPLQWLIRKFYPMPEWDEQKFEKLFGEKL